MIAAGRPRHVAFGVLSLAVVIAVAGCSSSHSSAAPRSGDRWPPPADPRAGSLAVVANEAPAPGGGIHRPATPVEVVAPPLPSGPVQRVPATIAHDCSVDVAPALEAWIVTVPDNSTISFASKACYRVDETVTLEGRHRMLLDGNGATLKAVTKGDRSRSQLQIKGGSDMTVRDLVIMGANPHAGTALAAYVPELEAQAAFQLNGVNDLLLDHVHASDTYGDFVYIGPEAKQPSRNVTVANSSFVRSGRQGMSITGAVGVVIEANTIDAVARSVFDLEANARSATIRDIRIAGNVTGPARNFWLANKGFAADVGNVRIVDNRMDAATGGLVFVYAKRGSYRGPFVVEHNRFIASGLVNDEGGTGAFFFAFSTDVKIRDNDVTFPKGKHMPAVELRNSHHVDVSGNHFPNVGRIIVASQGSSDYRAS